MLGKTFVMLLGEIEYMNIPIKEDGWRMLFFALFLFSMTLALLNLLNAVAITDTAEMIKEAEKDVLYNLLILMEVWEPMPLIRKKLTIFGPSPDKSKTILLDVFQEEYSDQYRDQLETEAETRRQGCQMKGGKDKVKTTTHHKQTERSIKRYIKIGLWRFRFGGFFGNKKKESFFENKNKIQFIVSNGVTDEAIKILSEKTRQVCTVF